MQHLQPFLNTFIPTFYTPNFIMMLFFSQKHDNETKKLKYKLKKINYPNNGSIYVEQYPENFDNMQKNSPIIIFVYGAFGNINVAYPRYFMKIMKKNNMRCIFVSRRGFNNQPLDSYNMLMQNELDDFSFITQYYKNKYNTNIYILGVSIGSSIIAQQLGKQPQNFPIKAFISIQNPYDLSNLTYQLQHGNIIQKLISKKLTKGAKKIAIYHKECKYFNNIFNKCNIDINQMLQDYDQLQHLYLLQSKYNIKIKNFQHVFQYYDYFSCYKQLQSIEVPSLFINSLDDYIATKDRIPYSELYKNKNIINLTFQRGGHIELLSGWDRKWFGFETAIKYIQYFETIKDQ